MPVGDVVAEGVVVEFVAPVPAAGAKMLGDVALGSVPNEPVPLAAGLPPKMLTFAFSSSTRGS